MKRVIVGSLVLMFAAGCDLFSTRSPESPNTGSTFIWTPATSVSYLLDDFTGTLTQLDASNYLRVFLSATDSTGSVNSIYSFFPTPGLDQGSRAAFTGWTPESERSWLSKLQSLVGKDKQLTVLLTNPVTDQPATTTATYSADYTISIPVPASSTAIPGVIQGSLQLQLVLVRTEQGTREWRIISWSDFRAATGDAATWTDLKVKLSS